MTKTIDIGSLHCDLYPHVSARSVTYILTPLPLDEAMIAKCGAMAQTHVVVASGMDWDNDLTPWPATGVPKGTPDFKGLAGQFLATLRSEVLPQCEQALGMEQPGSQPQAHKHDVTRNLVGISLSGLFALWAWITGRDFTNICSISGSFWYEGLVEWLQTATPAAPYKPLSLHAYFSLGLQEPKSRNTTFATVGRCTQAVIARLFALGIPVEFQSNPGNHYVDPTPRLIRAFRFLSEVG